MADVKERKSRLLGAGEIAVSFEFFPPKTEKMEEQLWASIKRLAPLAPEFVSVTYGAGGSTRERTHNTVARIVKETALRPAAHLTCVNATKAEVDEVARLESCLDRRLVIGEPVIFGALVGRGENPEAGAGFRDADDFIEAANVGKALDLVALLIQGLEVAHDPALVEARHIGAAHDAAE